MTTQTNSLIEGGAGIAAPRRRAAAETQEMGVLTRLVVAIATLFERAGKLDVERFSF